MHFAGHLTKGKAFMMESSTIVQLMTTPCEYHQKSLCYSNIFIAETTSQQLDDSDESATMNDS